MRHFYLLAFLFASCSAAPHPRAYGVPGATQRSPDLSLPLSKHEGAKAMLHLDGKTPPPGGWPASEAAEESQNVHPDTVLKFGKILDALTSTTPSARELDAAGRVGMLFDSSGANEDALDTRFHGDCMSGDLRVARKGEYLFVFYRRYPDGDAEGACARRGDEDTYCRLVIFKEVATRRD